MDASHHRCTRLHPADGVKMTVEKNPKIIRDLLVKTQHYAEKTLESLRELNEALPCYQMLPKDTRTSNAGSVIYAVKNSIDFAFDGVLVLTSGTLSMRLKEGGFI